MYEASSKLFCPPNTPPTWIRSRHFRITHIDLNITVDIPAERVGGTVAHHVEMLPHGSGVRSITLDQHDLTISDVKIDGTSTTFSLSAGQVTIVIPESTASQFIVELTYSVTRPAKGMVFVQANPERGYVPMAWTQGSMEDNSFWFPGFDNPNNISTYRIAIRHRSGLCGVANGDCVEKTDHGDGWTTSVYVQDRRHVLYLVNVVVGDFVAVEDVQTPVPITHYMPRGLEDKALAMFRATAFGIEWIGNFVGVPYPWTRYGHVVAHEFMWGGTENATLTTITDRSVVDGDVHVREDANADALVIHEIAHQWYGDLLTMKAWSDIWLNESFATYLEARGTAAWYAKCGYGKERDIVALHLWTNKQVYLHEDSGRYRRPLVTNRYADVIELFDRVAYQKGSLILHALSCYLGEDRFRAAIQRYTDTHKHDLVETADWRQAIEDVTGEAVDWFFAQWVDRPGHPHLKVAWRHDPVRKQVIIDVEQTQAVSNAELVYRLHLPIVIISKDGVERSLIVSDRVKDTYIVPAANAPSVVVVDPDADIPATWDEQGSVAEWCARLADGRIGAAGRARAAGLLGKSYATEAIIAALAAAAKPEQPELVRQEAILALGALRCVPARDVLFSLAVNTPEPRVRRVVARALSKYLRDAVCAAKLEELAHTDSSTWCVGEWLAARGAIEFPGASAAIRPWLKRDSWGQRLRMGAIRGLGASGEAAALDDVLTLLADDKQLDAVLGAAANAAAQLGARHVIARDRVRRAIEQRLQHHGVAVRVAATNALGVLGDPAASSAIAELMSREVYGNVRRVCRETLDSLGQVSAQTTSTATLSKRIEELEHAKQTLEQRLEALEKRLEKS